MRAWRWCCWCALGWLAFASKPGAAPTSRSPEEFSFHHDHVLGEHGKHVRQTGKIVCGGDPATLTLVRNAEADATVVEYAKKKSP